jgi:hypothetical protein
MIHIKEHWMKKAIMILFALAFLAAGNLSAAEIDESLQAIVADMPDDRTFQVLVYLTEQADVASLDRQLRAENATLAERNRRVIQALQETATLTQPAVVGFLDDLKAAGMVKKYRMFWIANMFWAEVRWGALEVFETRADLAMVYYNFEIEGIEPLKSDPAEPMIASHEIGLTRINAPAAWAQGWTGAGRVVMNIDTGVDGNHPALSPRFRGDVDSDGDVDESWFDPYTTHYPNPRDDNGHGTHTMGTICGRSETTFDTVGVAIDAQWIAAGAIDRGGGIPRTVQDAIASFQWAVDPDGDPGTQDNPDAIGNSWGVTTSHGYPPCDETFWTVIDNCEIAGSVVIFSAGNEGPNPSTHRRPADRGTTPTNCFSVGAVTGADQDMPIAGFSSRGPSNCGPNGETVIKPEVVAPGVNVRSSVPGGGYQGGWSGTSMASPHVTGSVAVIRQVNPNLDAQTIKQILIDTAVETPADLNPGEDNAYGNGIIDLYAACLAAQSGYGSVGGFVRDSGGNPLENVLVRIVGGFPSDMTDGNGAYLMSMPADTTYTLEASRFGYLPVDTTVAIVANDTATIDFVLATSPNGTIDGTVRDAETQAPLIGASVEIVSAPIDPVTTDGNGYYVFPTVQGGLTYEMRVRAAGHSLGQDSAFVPVGDTATVDFSLPAFESFEQDNGDWRGANSWEWGVPTSGPNSAYDGNNVWATVLDGNYGNGADDPLYTFYYTINDAVDTLTFYHWYEFENGHDGGNVSISLDNGVTWMLLYPEGDYPDISVNGLDSLPGYTGVSGGWRQAVFVLSGYQGMLVHFKFRFGSDGSVTRPGWYIDGVRLQRGITWADRNPEIGINRTSFSARLVAGDSSSQALRISNTGDGILRFDLRAITNTLLSPGGGRDDSPRAIAQAIIPEDVAPEKAAVAEEQWQADKDLEGDTNPPMLLDSGGPDNFGYVWLDSNEPNGPTFSWIDISGFGQPLGMSDDSNVGPLDLGFTMPYYGGAFGTIRVCSNGWISFSSASQSFSNTTMPNSASPNHIIAGFWDDLDPRLGGTTYYYTNSADSAIVSWVGVPHHSGNGTYTFEIILLGNGNILVQYETMAGMVNSATIGIEDSMGAVGLQVAYNQNWVTDGRALMFRMPQEWLSVSPSSDRLMPNASLDATVKFRAIELENGIYTGYIDLLSNDSDESNIVIPCTLYVGPVGVDDASNDLPTEFALAQNYPNPFNPGTQIAFALPVSAEIELTVFDLLGRRVKTLAGGPMAAGYHEVVWDGTDSRGRAVTSGIYFYSLRAGDYIANRKMLLMK